MLLVSQAANGSLSARRLPSKPNPNPLFANPNPNNPRFPRRRSPSLRGPAPLSLSGDVGPTTSSRRAAPSPPLAAGENSSGGGEDPVLVGAADDGVPLEGVIQLERPGAAAESKLVSSAKVGFLAGGDVLCLLIFSAIGRFSHGLPFLDLETLKTADPFIAGWLLSAYFLGGFGDDAKGSNGVGKAVTVAAKSWVVGIPLGIAIRAATSGHIPPTPFILVAMGSTGVLLTAWRALVSKILSSGQSKQDDVYRRGSPFELFELLTSLVRRW